MASTQPPSPRQGTIAILGAGSLGRLWGALLPPETGFVARPGQRHDPAGLSYRFEPVNGRVRQVTREWLKDAARSRLMLVTTKAYDTLPALEGILPELASDCPVVLFQNGLGSQQAVAERWPEHPVLAASTTEAANRPQPDRLIHAAAGQTWVGPLNEPARQKLDQVVTCLAQTGLNVAPEPEILKRLWAKLVINAGINPFTAILDYANGNILTSPLFLEHIDPLCGELARLMNAEGLVAQPKSLRQQIEQVARATASNTSSMRADVINGRQTEIDFINGYVARRSREHNLAAPVNQMLTERVQALTTGQHR